jgi:outer membrane protein assembly factor BamB
MNFYCRRRGWLLLAATIGATWAPARGDEAPPAVIPAESKATTGRIDEARKLLAAHKWSESVAEIQAILTASGDDLVSMDSGHSISCRRICHAMLAALPADALRSYRDAADPQARKWLDAGAATRDVRLVRKVVDEAFCSRPAEKALDLLGDYAFERGDFTEAEHWWRLLTPLPRAKGESSPGLVLFYPDPQADSARTRAKVLLARLFGGAYRWADELEAYRKDNGAAEGALAGKKGRYADIVRQVAAERNAEPPALTAEWPTFGGDASRGRMAVGPPRLLDKLGALCRPANERQFSLKDRKPLDEDPVYDRGAGPLLANRSMAFAPVVADGKAIVADARYVTAYDLRTGAAETWYDAAKRIGVGKLDLQLPAPPDLRYTPTVAGDRVFVRLGVQAVGDAHIDDKDDGRDYESLLVCLSLKPTPGGDRELWRAKAWAKTDDADKAKYAVFKSVDKTYAVFEGGPVVQEDRVYIASTRFVNGRALSRLHCYFANAVNEPQELWHQDICETREFADLDHRRYRQHLLTLAGPNVVYCSHSGAIAALDARTGKPAWAVRYPSRGDKTADGDPSPRDLAPALFAGGRLYVAPADYDRLLCLDPATGEKLWDRGPIEIVHLLGVGQGRLIFTTLTGLRAVDADDGVDAWALPDGGGALPPAGRGLLIGDLVLWPTAGKGPGSFVVYAVSQRDGVMPGDPSQLREIPAGKLIYADGCLLSADRQVLTLFAPPGLRLDDKEKQSRAAPDSAAATLELARAEADAGLTEGALESFGRAERLAAALSPPKRRRLDEAVRQGKYDLVMEAGRRAEAARRWDEADGYFKEASAEAFPPPLRLQALLETAALWKTAGQPDRAAAVWRGVQSRDELRGLIIEDEAGLPRSAAAFATARLGEASKRHGAATPRAALDPPAAVTPPFSRSWQAALDPGEAPLALANDLLLCGRSQPAGRLMARSIVDGKVQWQASLAFTPVWAGIAANVIVTAGESGAAGLRAEDGLSLWEFAAPPPSQTLLAETGTVLLANVQRADPLTDFHLVGGRLYFVQGDRRLFALDAETGDVLWARRAPGASLRQPYPDGRFWHVLASDEEILVQTSGGRRWLIDSATGRLLHDDPTATEPWPCDPVRAPNGRDLIATDARTVALLDPASGRDLWTYTLPGATTRTGEAPRIVAGPNALLLAWPTNIGWRMQRLDPATGKPTWDEPPLLNVGQLDVDGWSQDAEAFYGVQDRILFARSLNSGSVLWEQALVGPPGRWRTRRTGDVLFAYPVETRGAQFQFRCLFVGLQWEGRLALEDASGRGFPILCYDPKTGRLGQRMNLAVAPQSFAHLDSSLAGLLPALRLNPVEGSPLVSLSASGLLVALPGRAWALTAAK